MYPLTFFVKSLPKGFAGYAFGPLIFIQKSYKDNVGLHNHELEHVKQWFNLSLLELPIALLATSLIIFWSTIGLILCKL